jgi:hypothetical protein
MPGTVTVDVRSTFSTILLMSVAEKTKFGTDQPDISATGERKYTAELAVTYFAENGMRPVSEVVSVTVTGGDHNAILSIPPGSLVELDRLRCGVSAPERKENGRIAGGRLYWMAAGIRLAGASALRLTKSEQAS